MNSVDDWSIESRLLSIFLLNGGYEMNLRLPSDLDYFKTLYERYKGDATMMGKVIEIDYDVVVGEANRLSEFLEAAEGGEDRERRRRERETVVRVYERLREMPAFLEGLVERCRAKVGEDKLFKEEWSEVLAHRVRDMPRGRVSEVIGLFNYMAAGDSSECSLIVMCLSWLTVSRSNASQVLIVVSGKLKSVVEGGGSPSAVGALVGILRRCEFWCAGDGFDEEEIGDGEGESYEGVAKVLDASIEEKKFSQPLCLLALHIITKVETQVEVKRRYTEYILESYFGLEGQGREDVKRVIFDNLVFLTDEEEEGRVNLRRFLLDLFDGFSDGVGVDWLMDVIFYEDQIVRELIAETFVELIESRKARGADIGGTLEILRTMSPTYIAGPSQGNWSRIQPFLLELARGLDDFDDEEIVQVRKKTLFCLAQSFQHTPPTRSNIGTFLDLAFANDICFGCKGLVTVAVYEMTGGEASSKAVLDYVDARLARRVGAYASCQACLYKVLIEYCTELNYDRVRRGAMVKLISAINGDSLEPDEIGLLASFVKHDKTLMAEAGPVKTIIEKELEELHMVDGENDSKSAAELKELSEENKVYLINVLLYHNVLPKMYDLTVLNYIFDTDLVDVNNLEKKIKPILRGHFDSHLDSSWIDLIEDQGVEWSKRSQVLHCYLTSSKPRPLKTATVGSILRQLEDDEHTVTVFNDLVRKKHLFKLDNRVIALALSILTTSTTLDICKSCEVLKSLQIHYKQNLLSLPNLVMPFLTKVISSKLKEGDNKEEVATLFNHMCGWTKEFGAVFKKFVSQVILGYLRRGKSDMDFDGAGAGEENDKEMFREGMGFLLELLGDPEIKFMKSIVGLEERLGFKQLWEAYERQAFKGGGKAM
ncbi:hypothetical protein TrVE_jg14469 [Triparma verrucosa]|uniref:Uncharacterized protein n=1 Tax=Triparma verrucosa TaxID=1606542 RepID=A0A9W6Z5L7_9STRA|nr:hypothetical protein TrVE_jg14469 [Triparma verrucosa]